MKLRELAATLGLSQTTVSRALNGYPEVSEATRVRVQAAAERHNYRPSSRATALATGRSMAIGHVLPVSVSREMVNPVFVDFIAGASETYTRAGYDMILSVVADDEQEHHYRTMAAKRIVDGLIVNAPRPNDRRIALLKEIGIPFVVHGRATDADPDYAWIDIDNRRAFRRATEFLVDLGHRRIALLNGREIYDFVQRRHAGVEEGLAARDLALDPELVTSGDMTEQNGYRAARHLLALPDPPTALICSSTITAFGVRRAADELRLKLGRDLSLICHDDVLSYFRNGEHEPIFTAIRSSVWEAGRRAANALIQQIADPMQRPQIMLEADFVIGASTGPARTNRTRDEEQQE